MLMAKLVMAVLEGVVPCLIMGLVEEVVDIMEEVVEITTKAVFGVLEAVADPIIRHRPI